MSREKQVFFFTALDAYLRQGHEPMQALKHTVDDYAYVFHHDDGRPRISRASERALKMLENSDDSLIDDRKS